MLKHLMSILVLLAIAGVPAAQQVSGSNYTVQQANATINQVAAYLTTVNESGYLVFQPNLTAAYQNLTKAMVIYNSSPDDAVLYADHAYTSAHDAYQSISYYKEASLPAVVAFTIAMLVLLYRFMMPVPAKAREAADTKGRGTTRRAGRKHGG